MKSEQRAGSAGLRRTLRFEGRRGARGAAGRGLGVYERKSAARLACTRGARRLARRQPVEDHREAAQQRHGLARPERREASQPLQQDDRWIVIVIHFWTMRMSVSNMRIVGVIVIAIAD